MVLKTRQTMSVETNSNCYLKPAPLFRKSTEYTMQDNPLSLQAMKDVSQKLLIFQSNSTINCNEIYSEGARPSNSWRWHCKTSTK
jgi:hypothetical protein